MCMFGERGIGCKQLRFRYFQDFYCEEFDSAISDDSRKEIGLDGEQFVLDACQYDSDYPQLLKPFLERMNGFMVCYSIVNRDSFGVAESFCNQIKEVRGDDAPIVLCATQSDREKERAILKEEGEKIAQRFNCPFFETSSKLDVGVNEAFKTIAQMMKERKSRDKQSKKKEKCLVI